MANYAQVNRGAIFGGILGGVLGGTVTMGKPLLMGELIVYAIAGGAVCGNFLWAYLHRGKTKN